MSTDAAIIAARRRLLKMVRDLQQGIEPVLARHGGQYNVRPLDAISVEPELERVLRPRREIRAMVL